MPAKESGTASSHTLTTLETAESLYKTPTLLTHRVRCGKPTCRCTTGEGHGPYWYLYWRDGAVQRRRYVRQAEIEAVQAVVAGRRRDDRELRRAVALAVADLRRVRTWLRELEAGSW